MAQNWHLKTEALALVLQGKPVGDVLEYLWVNLPLDELGRFRDQLAVLTGCVDLVMRHKQHATDHPPDNVEVATPGEG